MVVEGSVCCGRWMVDGDGLSGWYWPVKMTVKYFNGKSYIKIFNDKLCTRKKQ